MSSATLVVPWSVCSERSAAKVPANGVLTGPGHRVADVGACDEGAHAAQWLFVDDQFAEQFAKRFGGRVVSAPQRHLSLGV